MSILAPRVISLAMLGAASAFKLPSTCATRRSALCLGAAALVAPLAPAFAKSKATVAPNKVEGVGANAGAYLKDSFKAEYEGIKGDKGTRGVASKDFDKNDTVQRNRVKNGGLARDADGKKKVAANRNRTPEELGLKQWTGN